MPEPKEHNILRATEATEISYTQVLAEFREDIFPAFAREGVPLGHAFLIYQLVCIENRIERIEQLLEEKYA
jgi:hypothetical protein